MLPVNRIGNGTLFSLRAQGAAVTTKTSDKNQIADDSIIMNATIVSAEAKTRLTEAVNNYTPPAPEKYRAVLDPLMIAPLSIIVHEGRDSGPQLLLA
jgi:hypothetical protein